MAAPFEPLGRWIAELRRRKVVRVAAAYLVAAWLVIQVAGQTFEPLGAPTWALRSVIIALILGFPVVCALAWAFDITLDGVERTPAAPSSAESAKPSQAVVAQPEVASVAVLPFTDLSPEHDQAYFCDGIAEEIINSLCCVDGLRVASRTSSFLFRERSVDAREIGRLLGVGAVLEGGVRKSGSRVRVTAQLVDCGTGYHHWSEVFDRNLDDVFALQVEIARKLVSAMQISLSPQSAALLERGGTTSATAYDLYLRGQAQLRDYVDSALFEAADLFRQATREDPKFAQAHAGLANALAVKGQWRLGLEPGEFEEAIRASQRALDLQPQMPEAHVASACLYAMQGRADEAEQSFLAALALNPGSYEANYLYARHCFGAGRYDLAGQYFEIAHRLRPDEFQAACLVVQTLSSLGRSADEIRQAAIRAVAAVEHRLELEPNDGRALSIGAAVAARLGLADTVRDWTKRALAARPGEFGIIYCLACAYSQLGDREEALRLLDEAVHSGRGNLSWIEKDADWEPLRDDPRFIAIIDRLRATD